MCIVEGKGEGLVIVKSRKSWEYIKIMIFSGPSCSKACRVLIVVIRFDQELCSILEGWNGGGFSLADFVKLANVIRIQLELLLSVFHLNESLAHCAVLNCFILIL